MHRTVDNLTFEERTSERFDRIYYSINDKSDCQMYSIDYNVLSDVKHSDHYPIEATFNNINPNDTNNQSAMINKKIEINNMIKSTSLAFILKNLMTNDSCVQMNCLSFCSPFVDQSDFDAVLHKIHDIIDKYFGKTLVFVTRIETNKYQLIPDESTITFLNEIQSTVYKLIGNNDNGNLFTKTNNWDTYVSFNSNDTINKSIPYSYEIILDKLHFIEYGSEGYMEPVRCISIKNIRKSKKQIIQELEEILNHKIIVGGSSLFESDAEMSSIDSNLDSDLDLMIVCDKNKRMAMKTFRKKLIFSGEVFNVDYVENQYNCYLKIKTFDDVSIDLHVYCSYETARGIDSLVTPSKTIHSMMVNMGLIDQYVSSLKIIKRKLKFLGLYGNTFCYFNGITIAIMLAKSFISNPDCISDPIKNFCEFYSAWDYTKPISLIPGITSTITDLISEKISNIMCVLSPTPPYENKMRNITKSTFNAIMDAFDNNLESLRDRFKHVLIMGIRSTDKKSYDAMIRYIESNILNIVLECERNNCKARPCSKWNERISTIYFDAYVTIYLEKNIHVHGLEKIKISLTRLYPDQLFKYEITNKNI
jgi:predicted nucleotidyltransferase